MKRAEDLCEDDEIGKEMLAMLYDEALNPKPPEETVEKLLDLMDEDADDNNISAEYIWQLADRNKDGALGFSELKRAMRNIDDVRAFLRVPRNTTEDEMDGICTDKLTSLYKELGKDKKDDITEDEWMKFFDDPEAARQRMEAEAEAAKKKEEDEAAASEAELARIMGLSTEALQTSEAPDTSAVPSAIPAAIPSAIPSAVPATDSASATQDNQTHVGTTPQEG